MQFTQLSLTVYKHQRQLNLSSDYVSWWIAKTISSCLPLLQTFNISKHSLLNIPTKQVSKRGYTQPTSSENTDKKSNSGIKLPPKQDKPRDQYLDLLSPQTQVLIHQHWNIMKKSQGNISPRNPIYPITAGLQKLKHARHLIQKRLFFGKDRSENLGKG